MKKQSFCICGGNMKIKVLSVAIIILVVSAIATASNLNESVENQIISDFGAEFIDQTGLEISNITGRFWKIGADITNIGDYNATNVRWDIYTHGRTITPIHFAGGNIQNIPLGESVYVYGVKPVFGFGDFRIIVKLECQNAMPVEEIIHAFNFFMFIIMY